MEHTSFSEDEEHLIKIIVSDLENNNFEDGISVTINNNPFQMMTTYIHLPQF